MTNKIPDYCEPLVGWRYWIINYYYLLQSRGVEWKPTERYTSFHHNPYGNKNPFYHLSGFKSKDCAVPCNICGVYAFKTREQLNSYIYGLYTSLSISYICVGEVYLWGEIVEHDYGYRAQYAYPKCLYGNEVKRTIANKYKVSFVEEEEQCISELNGDVYYQNPFPSLSPYQIASLQQGTWMGISRSMKPLFISSLPNHWKSQSILNPTFEKSIIKEPKFPTFEQKTFNIHKPVDWWKDNRSGLWLRTE